MNEKIFKIVLKIILALEVLGGSFGLFSVFHKNDALGITVNPSQISNGTFGTSLIPTANNTYDIGSNSLAFKDAYIAGNIYTGGGVRPVSNNATSLGTIDLNFANIYGLNYYATSSLGMNFGYVSTTIVNGTNPDINFWSSSATGTSIAGGNVVFNLGSFSTGGAPGRLKVKCVNSLFTSVDCFQVFPYGTGGDTAIGVGTGNGFATGNTGLMFTNFPLGGPSNGNPQFHISYSASTTNYWDFGGSNAGEIFARATTTNNTSVNAGLYLMGSTSTFAIYPNSSQALTINSSTMSLGVDVSFPVAGKGLYFKEGAANSKMGTTTLVAGTSVVNTTAVTANSRIFLTRQNLGTNPGLTYIGAISAGTSFTVSSTNASDTGTVAWLIVEPN